jgi:uncharacterized protein (TIGR02270 family)
MLSTIDAEVFERYAEEAAYLWSVRDGAVHDAVHDLGSLCELDGRIEAHLDGLAVAGDAGWEVCEAAIEDNGAGGCFAAMVLAVGQQDLRRIARVLDAGGGEPRLARGIVSALGWAPLARVQAILPALLFRRCSPALHYLGIAGGALARVDVGVALGYGVLSDDLRLRARALRAAGELGRADLMPEIKDAMSAPDEDCRFAAAWSAALLAEPAATPVLRRFAEEGSVHAAPAADMAMRRTEPAMGAPWVLALARSPKLARAALAGAAALGDTAVVPWLLEHLTVPETARAAGAVLSRITGVDLAASMLKTAQPAGFRAGPSDDPEDEDVAMDPDMGLPWPDAEAVRGWWKKKSAELRPGTRYLAGKPMSAAWLHRVLREGSQPARAAAALELRMHHGGRGLFEVRAPGQRQRRALG